MSVVGCHSDVVFKDVKVISDSKWEKADNAVFEFDVVDTIQPIDFSILIENEISYEFCNLYLFLRTYYPNGGFSQDTIQCLLADKRGEWLGKGFNTKSNKFLLVNNLRFPQRGRYVFELEQAMRVEPLEGISRVGISIDNSK